jgi:hypothetical protein
MYPGANILPKPVTIGGIRMKNKPLLIFAFSWAFFISSNNAIFAAQDDFRGTWVNNFTDDVTTVTTRFTISVSTLTMKIEVTENHEKQVLQEGSVEIIGWTESVNDDAETKDDFPDGLILETKAENGHISSFVLYISGDKKQLIFPRLNEDTDQTLIFIKE